MLRRKVAERLVTVKNETAMLTTFNEVDMTNIMEMRKENQQDFSNSLWNKIGFHVLFC